MINLGDAEKQKEMARGPVPKGSLVKVRMEIRKPKTADADPAVTVFKTGLKGLDCEFIVASGQFSGVKIWENWFLPPAMQTVKLNKGQEGVCNSGFSKMRAVIEAARGLDPDDPAANRNISSWFDLHGLEFPVKIGVKKPEPGDQFINNTIGKVLSIKDEEFPLVMGGSEVITDEPFPDLPNAPDHQAGKTSAGWSQPDQGVSPKTTPPAPTPEVKPPKQQPIPAWAQ